MICKNCGSEIAEELRFCDKCGAAVEAPAEEAAETSSEETISAPEIEAEETSEAAPLNVAELLSETEPEQPAKKAKKSRKGLKITAVILAVLVALGGVAFLFRDKIEKIMVGFASPERQLQYTYAKAAGGIAGLVFEGLDEAYATTSASSDNNLTLSLSDEFKNLLGIDKYYSGNDLKFDFKLETNMPVIHILGTLKAGGKEVLAIDLYEDATTGEMVMSLPGINDKFVSIYPDMYEDYGEIWTQCPVCEYMEETEFSVCPDCGTDVDAYWEDYEEDIEYEEYGTGLMDYLDMFYADSMEKMVKKILPSTSLIKKITTDAVEAALDVMDGVTSQKAEFTAGGITQSATCLKAEVTEKVVSQMAVAALNELKDNGSVKKYIKSISKEMGSMMGLGMFAPDSDMIYSYYQMAIQQVIKGFKQSGSDKLLFTLDTYIDSDYNILAIELTFPEEDTGSFFIGTAKKGGETGFEFSARGKDGTVPYSLTGKTEAKQTTYTFSQFGKAVANCKVAEIKNGYSLLLTLDDAALSAIPHDLIESNIKLSDYALKIESTTNKNDYNTIMAVVDAKDTSKVHMGVVTESKLNGKSNVVMKQTNNSDVEKWASEINLEKLISQFKAAGINENALAYVFGE